MKNYFRKDFIAIALFIAAIIVLCIFGFNNVSSIAYGLLIYYSGYTKSLHDNSFNVELENNNDKDKKNE